MPLGQLRQMALVFLRKSDPERPCKLLIEFVYERSITPIE